MRETIAYRIARWGYQPIKHARLLATELQAVRARGAVVSEYLSRPGFKGLQIGSGTHHRSGWLNSDIAGTPGTDIGLDITKPLPFRDESLHGIYGSEVIEHIPKQGVIPFLREAIRVLKPGGALRLTTPDIVEVCRIALGLNDRCTIEDLATTWLEDANLTRDVWVNAMFRSWGHQYLWDFESMRGAMAVAGYRKIERVEPQITNSGIAELANLETRYGVPPPRHGWAASMIIEATK